MKLASLKTRMANSETVIGSWITLAHPAIAGNHGKGGI